MVTLQGDIFWVDLPPPRGSGPGYRRPLVIIQNDKFNNSKISTVVACIISSNRDLIFYPGNVALAAGEANLPKPSVVNVTQIVTVDRSELGPKIGTLSKHRITEILEGIALVLESV